MSGQFDAYHGWLGISPKDQPPDHYRLLGIDRLENDAAVIERAARHQMDRVRSRRTDQRAEAADRLLKEIGAARECLLDGKRKSEYDIQLKAGTPAADQPLQVARRLQVAEPLPPPVKKTRAAPARQADSRGSLKIDESSATGRRAEKPAKTSSSRLTVIIGGCVAGAALLILVIFLALGGNDQKTVDSSKGTDSRKAAKAPEKTDRSAPAGHRDERPKPSPAEEPDRDVAGADDKPDAQTDESRKPPPGSFAELIEKPTPDDAEKPSADAGELNLADLIEQVDPSVVRIDVVLEDGRAIGSGFVVDRQGAVVTNYHVIEGAKSAQVVFADKRTAPVMGYLAIEPDRDLALIRINVPAGGLTPLPIAADLPRKGEGVAAFGAPKGFSFTASEGIVSAIRTGEEIRETLASSAGFDLYARLGFGLDAVWIQTSAPISDGNSGGPLLNMRGQVIGVNTWGHSGGQNLNFAGAAPAVIEIITKSDAPLKPLAGLPASRSHDSLAGTPEPVPGPSEDTGGVELPDHVTTRGTPGEIHSFTLHSGAVTDLAVSPSGRYLATAGADKTVCIVDLPTLETIHRLKADVGQFTAVAFSHDGEYLATGSTSGALEKSNLRIWEVESGKQVVGFSDRGSATQSVRFSPGGRFLVSTHGGGVADLRVFPRIHGVNAIVGRDRNLPCFGADFSPDGQYMALAGGDGQMYVWSLVGSPRSAGDMLGHNGAVLGMAFSPNGKFIASCGEDGEARIWSDWVTSGNWKTVRELAGKAPVTDVAWSPDGTWLATACADNRVRVWDLAKGKTRNVFSGHRKTVTSVAFLNSGDYLVSSSEDGTARLWQLGTGDKRPAGTDVAATPTQRRNKPDKKANEAVPTGDELAAVTKTVQGIFQDELAKAKLPTQKRELAETILRHGQEEKNTAAERYALLSEARRLAIESGATSAALDATDELIAWFDVDAVELQVETVQKLGQTVRLNQDRIELAAVALQFAAESYSSDRYGEAASLAAVASVAANKARDAKLIQAARQWSQRTREAEAPWDEYQTALEQLKAKPTDSAAHLAVGTYLCFSRGDWQAGLKHLAQGSDAKLRAVAARDLAAPADAESRIAIGRSWRELAETAHQDHRQAYLAAAHYWYTKALPDQSGLGKLKIEDLLKDIGEIPAEMQRK